MDGLIIGAYGIYLALVGFKGNASDLLKMGQADAPGFLPWAISIGALAVMYELPATKKIAEPFIALVVIGFIVKNFETLKAEFKQLSAMASSASQTPIANTAPPATQNSAPAAPSTPAAGFLNNQTYGSLLPTESPINATDGQAASTTLMEA